MVFSPGDEVTVSRTETRTVTVRTPYNGGRCFIGTDGESYHMDDNCLARVTGKTPWNLESVRNPEPDNWPPQENDIWKTDTYTLHFVNGEFTFKNKHSASVTILKAEEVLAWEPKLLFRVKK